MKKKYNGVIEIIAMKLKQEGFIQASDIAIVKYSIDYLCQSLIYHIILIFIGILTCHYLFSLIYILVMGCLKHFTGGAHAPNATLCSLLSYSIFLATMYLNNHLIITSETSICSILSLNIIITLFLAPVECRNKRFDQYQRHRLKRLTSIGVAVISVILGILLIYREYYIVNIILTCLSINTVNLVVGFILNKKEINDVPEHSSL